jgi:hypothetical protein
MGVTPLRPRLFRGPLQWINQQVLSFPRRLRLPLHVDRARLRTLVSHFLVEPDRIVDLKLFEVPVQEAVPVEVDLAPVERLDESVILLGIQPGDAPARRGCVMEFGSPVALQADAVLAKTARGQSVGCFQTVF